MALRALVAAHAQSAWNRSTRQLTRAGRNFALALIAFGWLFGATGFGAGMFGLGWAAGRELEGRGLALAGVTMFALSWGLGILFGLTGSGRLLEVGQLKAYPVRPWTLLFAELAARLAEPLSAGVIVALFAFQAGLAISAPSLVPRLLILFLLHAFTFLCVQFVLGELLAAIARRARIALVIVTILATGFSPRFILALGLGEGQGSRFERLERIAALIQRLPTSRLLSAPDLSALLVDLAQALVGPIVLLIIGMRVIAREQTALAAVATERERGLWTFDQPEAGVARLHLSTLFRTPVGRYSLVAPLFAMVMVPWVIQLLFQVQRTSLAVFLYAAFGTVQFHFNIFGFDGPSVAELFRLPISARTILRGKQAAIMALVLLEGAVLALFLRVVREEALDECLAGLCVFMAANLVMATLGRFVSIVWPRTLPRSGMRGSAPPLPVVLVNLFGTFGITGVLGGSHWLVMRYAPALLVPWGFVVLLGAAGLFWVTLTPATAFFERRREHVLLAMK